MEQLPLLRIPPLLRRSSTILSEPCRTAIDNGVTPAKHSRFGSAPSARSHRVISSLLIAFLRSMSPVNVRIRRFTYASAGGSSRLRGSLISHPDCRRARRISFDPRCIASTAYRPVVGNPRFTISRTNCGRFCSTAACIDRTRSRCSNPESSILRKRWISPLESASYS